MLAWRGKDRDELLAALRGKSPRSPGGAGVGGGAAAAAVAEPGTSPVTALLADVTGPPLEDCLADFWSPGLSQARLRALPASPAAPPDLLLRLADPPPVLVRGASLRDILAPAYERLGDQPGEVAQED
jgi:hypothetical protein